jgi:hypothetical protein
MSAFVNAIEKFGVSILSSSYFGPELAFQTRHHDVHRLVRIGVSKGA